MPLGKKTRLALATMAAAAAWGYAFYGDTGIRQARWMADSQVALPSVSDRLQSDARFRDLTAFVSTACNIVVVGTLDSEQDLRDLDALLGDLVVPHGLLCLVRVE